MKPWHIILIVLAGLLVAAAVTAGSCYFVTRPFAWGINP